MRSLHEWWKSGKRVNGCERVRARVTQEPTCRIGMWGTRRVGMVVLVVGFRL
jgi:hypothetical protein